MGGKEEARRRAAGKFKAPMEPQDEPTAFMLMKVFSTCNSISTHSSRSSPSSKSGSSGNEDGAHTLSPNSESDQQSWSKTALIQGVLIGVEHELLLISASVSAGKPPRATSFP